MTPEQENYNIMMAIRKEMIENSIKNIHHRIEQVCRYHDEVIITDHGFGRLTNQGYETSLQKEIVDQLSKDGYTCTICFDYPDNKAISYLRITW